MSIKAELNQKPCKQIKQKQVETPGMQTLLPEEVEVKVQFRSRWHKRCGFPVVWEDVALNVTSSQHYVRLVCKQKSKEAKGWITFLEATGMLIGLATKLVPASWWMLDLDIFRLAHANNFLILKGKNSMKKKVYVVFLARLHG